MAAESEARWKKPKMVGWFDPGQLLHTGVRTLLSTALGGMLDARRLAAVEAKDDDSVFDYRNAGEEFWFDFIADTGDGWNSTYTMAYLLSSQSLDVKGLGNLPRPPLLLLGGDEVYPTASKMEYAKRLVWPFNQAARQLGQFEKDLAHVFCIPGNHDWYDSLASFTRRFCNNRRIGSFRTRQTRSYFVLLLPHNWQIWGTDIQLSDDIDVPQMRFFRRQASKLTPQDRVILCLAEPDWVYGEQAGHDLHFNVERFEEMAALKQATIPLMLAGDVHNYQHYTGDRPATLLCPSYRQVKLVSGGGGAFLHPNHSFPIGGGAAQPFKCVSRYPEEKKSKQLSWRILLFPFKNWKMASLLGVLYVLAFWNLQPSIDLATFPVEHLGPTVVMLSVMIGFWRFGSNQGHPAWGVVHGVSQLWMACMAWRAAHGLFTFWPAQILFQWLAAGLLGGGIFGLYLFLSLNLLKCHHNEAFSSLSIPDYKNFLRIRVTADGLRIHALGVEKTAPEESTHPVNVHCIESFSIT